MLAFGKQKEEQKIALWDFQRWEIGTAALRGFTFSFNVTSFQVFGVNQIAQSYLKVKYLF